MSNRNTHGLSDKRLSIGTQQETQLASNRVNPESANCVANQEATRTKMNDRTGAWHQYADKQEHAKLQPPSTPNYPTSTSPRSTSSTSATKSTPRQNSETASKSSKQASARKITRTKELSNKPKYRFKLSSETNTWKANCGKHQCTERTNRKVKRDILCQPTQANDKTIGQTINNT